MSACSGRFSLIILRLLCRSLYYVIRNTVEAHSTILVQSRCSYCTCTVTYPSPFKSQTDALHYTRAKALDISGATRKLCSMFRLTDPPTHNLCHLLPQKSRTEEVDRALICVKNIIPNRRFRTQFQPLIESFFMLFLCRTLRHLRVVPSL